jgi:hypothetical protein
MKKKTKKLLAIIIIVALITTIFLIVIFQENNANIDTISAKSLNLNLKDLPDGYIECSHNDSNHQLLMLYKTKGSYRVLFFKGDCSNWAQGVDSITVIFNSTDDSINFFKNSTAIFRGPDVEEARNILGDESYGIEVQNANNIIGYALCFRISKIVAVISYLSVDYTFAFNLAKIVEQRIYDSMK